MHAEKPTIPLAVKVLYTGFLCILVPYYLRTYGPTNFLYFCDISLFLALIAIWKEESLWASMAAVGILLPQTLWIVDFLGRLFGVHIVGMTDYMFDSGIPLFARGLSLFHFWLPLVLVWIIWQLGYDRRALPAWTVLAWILMLTCFFLMPAPPPPQNNPNIPVNINYVYGLSDAVPQQWMHPLMYFTLMMIGLPLCIFMPTHLVLRRVFHVNNKYQIRCGSTMAAAEPPSCLD
jgi:hypothetical protein